MFFFIEQVVGVPVSLNGDLKNQFVETTVGFDTVCKVDHPRIRSTLHTLKHHQIQFVTPLVMYGISFSGKFSAYKQCLPRRNLGWKGNCNTSHFDS
jgi:hypothetical protein